MSLPSFVQSVVLFLGDQAADPTAYKFPVLKTLRKIKIIAVKFGAKSNVAAADTNYLQVKLTDGTTTFASITTGPVAGGDSLTLGQFLSKAPAAAWVSMTGAEVPAATNLMIEFAKTGTGMAIPGLTIQVDYMESGA
jgi:hypothetical protein